MERYPRVMVYEAWTGFIRPAVGIGEYGVWDLWLHKLNEFLDQVSNCWLYKQIDVSWMWLCLMASYADNCWRDMWVQYHRYTHVPDS